MFVKIKGGCITIFGFKFCLVSDWKKFFRWFSVQCYIAAIGLQAYYATMDKEQKKNYGAPVTKYTIIILAIGLFSRPIKQYPEIKGDCPCGKIVNNTEVEGDEK